MFHRTAHLFALALFTLGLAACSGDRRDSGGIVYVTCGDGVLQSNEGCDDGNRTNGDGCSSACQPEGTNPVCGNSMVEAGETCDDGNTTPGDGCSATCQTEGTTPVCGNGVVEAGEQCDDNNTTSGDGCSSTCQNEGTTPVCGNGIVEAGEQCDDNNTTSGDGCSSTCQNEMTGFTCQQACDKLRSCTEMECPGTVDVADCVTQCTPDPVAFQVDLIDMLTCTEINMQICPPPAQETNAGAACMVDADCIAGTLQPFCVQPIDMNGMATGWVDGYCFAVGCTADVQCGANKLCVQINSNGTRACLQGCTPSNNGAGVCRSGYQCPDLSGGNGIGACVPACTANADCATGETCNTATGQCT